MSDKRVIFNNQDYFYTGGRCISFEHIILLETESHPDNMRMERINIWYKSSEYDSTMTSVENEDNEATRFLDAWGNWRSSKRK